MNTLRCLFIIFLVINSISCITSINPIYRNDDRFESGITIPEWFIHKPQMKGIKLVYAYSANYLDRKKEQETLLLSAAKNFELQKQTHIVVLQNVKKYSGFYSGGEYVRELEPELNTNNLTDKYSIISRYKDTKWILAIVAEKEHLKQNPTIKTNQRLKNLYHTSPPKWAKRPPVQRGFIYGVGLATGYCSPEGAWIVAEQNARADIALQRTITIYSENRSVQILDFVSSGTESKAICNVFLKNVSIIKHGYCSANNTYYALARMAEKDAVALIKSD